MQIFRQKRGPLCASLSASLCGLACLVASAAMQEPVFDKDFPNLDSLAVGRWWTIENSSLRVPRDQVVAFALYTHDQGTLKMTAQLFPLMPDEAREVCLELQIDGAWTGVARSEVVFPGWSAHFRVDNWDNSRDVPYRVRHGSYAVFQGLIRRDPVDKDVIVVANMSCNSSRTPGPRETIVNNLKRIDPDLLFFAGDQTYKHTQHTEGWLEWGIQFRDVLRDRPVVTIPDDHDVGQANLWGEHGIRASTPQGPGGGYFYPVSYVNMVQRCQTWHLPDPVDPAPVDRGIAVYFTRLRVGGIDFAVVEDRKFKSGPQGKIPPMGPRPDHINQPDYDRTAIDLPGLDLLGERQIRFLNDWSADWTGAEMKCVLSQTAFCGAVHLHGSPDNRLIADLDCNGWPQSGRNEALRALRRCQATHLCGDQHLAVVVKHGIESERDGPYGFTSPALVNTIYGRWWHPADELPGPHPAPESPLPWTGDYRDGLGNHISMMAYANPEDPADELKRADGFGVARFNKRERTVTFECWPRFSDVSVGDRGQFPGWPMTVPSREHDGRLVVGYLRELVFTGLTEPPVIQVIDERSGEILYTVRAPGLRISPAVYRDSIYTVKAGVDRPDGFRMEGLEVWKNSNENPLAIELAK